MKEQVRYWRSAALDGLELLKATYIEHAFTPHTREGYVIGAVESGVETFRYRGSSFHAPKDHIVLINPGEVHTGSAGIEDGWTYRTLYPAVDLIRRATGLEKIPYFPEAVVHDPALAKRLRVFHRLTEQGTQLEQDSHFLVLLAELLERHGDAAPPHVVVERHPKVEQARAFLEAYPERATSLADLAKLTDSSPHHLLRVFKRSVGLPPHTYQLQERVRHAKGLLGQGMGPAQVAVQLGFSDQSHFGYHFKRFTGVTPGQFARGAISS